MGEIGAMKRRIESATGEIAAGVVGGAVKWNVSEIDVRQSIIHEIPSEMFPGRSGRGDYWDGERNGDVS
jgi:hypothetical protein